MKTAIMLLLTLMIWPRQSHAREVSFSWEPMEGATQYEIQLSKSEDCKQPFLDQKLQVPEFSSTLDTGRYFYRVRVIDKKKHNGKWSGISPIVIPPYPPELLKPSQDFETSYYEHKPEINFEWKATDLTATYEITILDGSGTEVLHTSADKNTFKTNLGGGEYQWQVKSLGKSAIPGVNGTNADIPSDFSKPWKFKVVQNKLEKPVLKTPADGAKGATRIPKIGRAHV